jgi:aspartate beta-hydroxylase
MSNPNNESLDINLEDLGGTDDWGDDDLASVDDLEFGDEVADDVDDDDGSPVVEPDEETEEETEEETAEEAEDETEEETEDTQEVEPTADEGEEEEETDEVESKKSDNRVPLSRLNKEVDKRRALEARIMELEKSPGKQTSANEVPAVEPEAPAFTLDDFKAMSEAILDGDDAKALEKFSSMTQAQVDRAIKSVKDSSRNDARNEIQADKDTTDLQTTAVSITEQYPEFDSSSEMADKALIEEVLDLRDAFENKGLSPANALAKASRLVAMDNELSDRSSKSIDDTKGKKGVKPSDVKKKIKLASKEKGKLQGAANRSRKLAKPLADLSDEEFNDASEDALARARGDFV